MQIAGRSAKIAKTTLAPLSEHPEILRIREIGPDPEWLPKVHEIWQNSRDQVYPCKLAPSESHRCFSLPPIHLFWKANDKNKQVYFYHFFVLHWAIKNRAHKNLPPLSTGDWKQILGDSHWKNQWKPQGADKTSTFDAKMFWKQGSPLLFEEEENTQILKEEYDPTSLLPCNCPVEMDTASDQDVQQAALYHLNRLHAIEEIKDMEHHLFPTSFTQRWTLQREFMVTRMVTLWVPWDSSSSNPNPVFFHDKTSWRLWLSSVYFVVQDWNGFDSWSWGGLQDIKDMDIDKLPKEDFRRLTDHLLVFFIQSFVTQLAYYPSPLRLPPVLASHYCWKHCRKFSEGGLAFPSRHQACT